MMKDLTIKIIAVEKKISELQDEMENKKRQTHVCKDVGSTSENIGEENKRIINVLEEKDGKFDKEPLVK